MNGLRKSSKLATWRQEADFTLSDVAGLTGYSVAMLSRAERGQRSFSAAAKVHIARCLGVQVADLFEVEAPADAA